LWVLEPTRWDGEGALRFRRVFLLSACGIIEGEQLYAGAEGA